MLTRDEAGVSIVEILIATFILFFVITAIMGLLSVSFVMATTARYQSSATAFANRQIEQIRALPFVSVGTQGGDPNGVLVSSETTVSNGVTYSIARSVTWIDDVADNSPQTPAGADSDRRDYKDISVTVYWQSPVNGQTYSISAATSIREPWSTSALPTVEFTAGSVPANSIVFGDQIYNGGSLVVQVNANDNLDADGKIASVVFYVDGRVLRNPGWSPAQASWSPDQKSITNYPFPAYSWNTLAVDESGTPMYPDGIRELKAEVWDNTGQRDFKVINVFVDNYAPDAPTDLVAALSTANGTCFDTMNLTWTGARDGTDWADQYQLARNKNGTADTTVTVAGTLTNYANSSLTPFSVYAYRMRSVSPRLLASSYTAWTGSVMTRPRLTGTAAGNGNDRQAVLTWTGPTFAITSAQYLVHRALGWISGNITSAAVATVNHPTVTWTSASFNKNNEYYWQIEARYVVGGVTYTAWSNVIGPAPLSGAYPIPP